MGADEGRKIRLVASDLDGTLLGQGQRVPEDAFGTIERVAATGAHFLAASGRQYASLRRLFAPVADTIGYVAENGALVVLGGEVLVRHRIERGFVMDVCHAAMELPGCDYLVSCERMCYVPSSNPELYQRLVTVTGNDTTMVDAPKEIPDEVVKVAFFMRDKGVERAVAYFGERFGGLCRAVTSGSEWVDLLIDGVDKGTALAELAGVLGVDAADMAAFGDAGNDREMLELVGHPYLMKCHTSEVRDLEARCRPCSSVPATLEQLLAEGRLGA